MTSFIVQNKLEKEITLCQNFLKTLTGKINENQQKLTWFTDLCSNFTKIIILISRLNKDSQLNQENKDTVLLYLTQLISLLSFLINIFVRETDIEETITEARICVRKQIILCLDGVKDCIITGKALNDPSGCFIKWMDSSLDKIMEIGDKDTNDSRKVVVNEAKTLFDEVLSHAMSIAQIALVEDCKIIKGSSQSVLEAIACLNKEVSKTDANLAMVHLFADNCSDKLCLLEQKVNTAVLKLCLKVFSEFTIPLEQLHQFCLDQKNKGKTNEFDSLVADFDLHVDRIMQIGLFSISCSTCTTRGIKIRSCLASLEALETELVPTFTSVLHDFNVQHLNYALLLENHWLSQAKMLRKLIFEIIEPFAFCQVIYQENNNIIELICDELKLYNNKIKLIYLDNIIDNCMVLKDFINVAIKDNETDKLLDQFRDFKNVLKELTAAKNLLLKCDDKNSSSRLIKRCKILVNIVKKISHCFIVDEEKENIGNVEEKLTTNENSLDIIIDRGIQILKERSVLYKSKCNKNDLNVKEIRELKIDQFKCQNMQVSLTKSKAFDLRKLYFFNGSTKNETSLDLEITHILNDLTNMSQTFSSKK